MKARIIKYNDSLYLISLPVPISGFQNFIGAWVYSGKKTFIIDPGPSSTVGEFCNALKKIGIKRLDYILLTHIHLDHSGGIGDIAEIFHNVPIVCHSSTFRHLTDPERLWKSSVNILQDKAYAYGNIKPVHKNRLIQAEKFSSDGIKGVQTPGHSVHSVSFITDKYLFAGEACGVYLKQNNGEEYLRPATPPKFFFETTIESIQKLIRLKPENICFGHFGISDRPDTIMRRHIEQLHLWKKIIKKESVIHSGDNLFLYSFNKLLSEDNLFARFHGFNREVKERELFFIKNSFDGFVKYLASVEKTSVSSDFGVKKNC